MSEGISGIILSLSAGGAFGLLYMVLLWGAVRILTSGHSVWLFAALGLLRAGLLVGALWLAVRAGATAANIAVALLGFIAVRLLATRLAKTVEQERASWK
mgnify:CR=1 FL=1